MLKIMVAGLLFFLAAPHANAASVEHPSAIDGTDSTKHYAVVTPTYRGNGTGPQTYLRLYNGKNNASSTFTVTVVGTPSGRTYGNAFTVAVPRSASIQFSIQEIEQLAAAGSFTGGDTGFSVYLQNSDSEAGYQHAVYDWTSQLFENFGSCQSTMNEQMLALHNQLVLANVHTSKAGGGNFPSTILIHNYASTSATYTLNFYNGGDKTISGTNLTLASNSGKFTCEYAVGPVTANSTLSVPFSTIEANPGCTLDSDETYANVVVTNKTGAPPNASVTHSIRAAQYSGNVNFSEVCAVNKVANVQVTSTTKFQGVVAGPNNQSGTFAVTVPVGASASAGSPAPVAHAQSLIERAQALTVTGSLILSSGTITLTGTYDSATNALNVSGGGYTFTGTVAGSAYTGTYQGPNNVSGGFSAVNGTQNTVTAYCGTFQDVEHGTVNISIGSSGVLYGTAVGEEAVTLIGQATGSSFTGVTSDQVNFTGTYTAQSLNGSYTTTEGNAGTFAATACAVP